MRNTVVYILRLLVDNIEPSTLRGILRNVTSGEEQVFSSELGLLKLLHSQQDNKPDTKAESQTDQIRRVDV
jgi:hypothetical protein